MSLKLPRPQGLEVTGSSTKVSARREEAKLLGRGQMRYLDPETTPRGDGGRSRYQPYGRDRQRDTRPRYQPRPRSRSPPRTGADSNDWRRAARAEPKFDRQSERERVEPERVQAVSPDRREERADREMSMEIDNDDE